MEQILNIINQVDTKVWIIVGVILVAIAIIKIIVKGIKGVAFILIVGIIISGIGGFMSYLNNEVGISYKNGQVIIDNETVGYKAYDIDLIESIKVENEEDEVYVEIISNNQSTRFKINPTLAGIANEIIDNLPVKVSVK